MKQANSNPLDALPIPSSETAARDAALALGTLAMALLRDGKWDTLRFTQMLGNLNETIIGRVEAIQAGTPKGGTA